MDLSSELIHALLPLYMATALGRQHVRRSASSRASPKRPALIVKLFSGVISDFFRKRKPLVLLGYGLAALTKFVFPLAPTLGWIVGARFADRVGKGIRGAPRDALIADITPPASRAARASACARRSTPSAAIGGPLLAIGAMAYFAGDFRAAFWVAVVPAMLAVVLIVVGVDEPGRPHDAKPAASRRIARGRRAGGCGAQLRDRRRASPAC